MAAAESEIALWRFSDAARGHCAGWRRNTLCRSRNRKKRKQRGAKRERNANEGAEN